MRRFSAGATLTVLGLSLVPGSSNTVTNSSTVSTAYNTTGASQRIGYGITAQAAITDRFTIAVGGYLRRIGYQFNTTVTTTTLQSVNGVLTPISTSTSTHEDTRARLFDVPLVLRFYSKGRHTPGPRWFVEGGGAFRDSNSIRTSLSSTNSAGTLSCCTNTPAVPSHRTSIGFVGGAGFQLIDPFGIRVIPEVRYTRWMTQTFDAITTRTEQNQVEAVLTLSF